VLGEVEVATDSEKLAVLNTLNEKWSKFPSLSAELILQEAPTLSKLDLNKLSWDELASLCSVLQIGTRLPAYFLRRRLDRHFDHIKKDDQFLFTEGVDAMTEPELHQASLERGLKVLGLSFVNLQRQLKE